MRLKIQGRIALISFLLVNEIQSCYGWGTEGHEIVATIAQMYLHPSALHGACAILSPNSLSSGSIPPCHLANVATWADEIKTQPHYRFSKQLHFIGAVDDYPPNTCNFPGPKGWNSKLNVVSGVRNTTTILRDHNFSRDSSGRAEEALKFLIHFLGDMHQPLHLSGRQIGGNAVKVTFGGELTSMLYHKYHGLNFIDYHGGVFLDLHSVWDDFLIDQKMKEITPNYTHPLPPRMKVDVELHLQGKNYDPYIRRLMYDGLGVGPVPGRFVEDAVGWLSCPQTPTPSIAHSLQTAFGLRKSTMQMEWDDDALCPLAWAKLTQSLNCKFPTWPRELDEHVPPRRPMEQPVLELDIPSYSGRIREGWLVEKLLAQGGIRLAGILNGIFMPMNETTVLPYIPQL
ncbi:hypothetical protein NLI96_g5036 [Meripilus lineatus]|uniref:Phospholipase C/P1 nuclease n=1 Tax=Meripilus lineatus TaxID=2056292 RepID=A0AAD5V5N2_9APHY|nr:hypothetical protein NLI96_g5036 [Physisporinus lineatus]